MTHHLFEGKDHASVYQKYRFTPPDEIKDIILQYLDEKVDLSLGELYRITGQFCLFGDQNQFKSEVCITWHIDNNYY